MKKAGLAIYIVALLLVAGCGSSPSKLALLKEDSIKNGITTFDDVEDMLGDDYHELTLNDSDYIMYDIDPAEVGAGVLSARLVFEVKDDIVQRYFVDKSMECNEEAGIYCIQSRAGRKAEVLRMPRKY